MTGDEAERPVAGAMTGTVDGTFAHQLARLFLRLRLANMARLSENNDSGGMGSSLYRPFPPEHFNALRRKATQAIVRLKAATEGKPPDMELVD
ncbi:unnamed protein product [marine sediment metagenome]|uniref:Uncharacterized protein n=1 Tax=marine sediment metagenome TaxID=412755 RepID=X1JIT2_9ZZZZ